MVHRPMLLLAAVAMPPSVAAAQGDAAIARPAETVTLSPAQLFDFADAARDAGDFATAESAYRALAANPDLDIRTEARFRHALMLSDRQQRYRDAAVLLRRILDEKPDAGRVRIELARMQAQMGHLGAAERELRAAAASGLPPEVEQLVRFYAGALSAQKPVGANLEIAIAPDTNINRATRADTLDTVLGDFTLNEDAKARSGIGLALRGQGFARAGLDRRATLLARIAGAADVYRQSQFNNMAISLQAGPEYVSGRDRIAVIGGPGWRWFGQQPFSFSVSGSASWLHPIGQRTQLRADGGLGWTRNRFNDLQSGTNFNLSLGVDRAISPRFGGGAQIGISRDGANDPGFATTAGSVGAYAFRELGQTTAVVSIGFSHLDSDARLLLYTKRRIDNRLNASLSGTFRALRLGTLAPYARVQWERNFSTVTIFDFSRLSAQFGLTAAF
jgi:tetratricopeptide (TPR) repeat protein